MKLFILVATLITSATAMLPIKPSEYRGILSTTAHGRTCQEWQLDTPHSHHFHKPPNNFCRDPDNTGAIWCYTTDPKVRWERCDQRVLRTVPYYEVIIHKSKEYTGTLSRTINGRTCQEWDTDEPQKSNFHSLPSNYCRNPDGERTIWCYTTDPRHRWELCDNNALVEIIPTLGVPSSMYRGILSTTVTGRTCQEWSSDTPHSHNFTYLPNNYCRDPNGKNYIWCFTTDPNVRSEKCDQSVLMDELPYKALVINSTEYTGTLRTTLTGKTCRYWNSSASDIEDKHKNLPGNFCRDPDSEGFLWCYAGRKEKCDPDVLTLIYY